jgi:hypothetical protein
MEYIKDEFLSEEIKGGVKQADDTSEDIKVFDDMSKIDGIIEYFEKTMARDLMRYFNQQDDSSRGNVKGHYYLAKYLRDRILKSRDSLQK